MQSNNPVFRRSEEFSRAGAAPQQQPYGGYGQPSQWNVGQPGGAFGLTVGGTVESSNVDLATEFTNMIVAQRGFQANSRVISTADSMLEELVNLKR